MGYITRVSMLDETEKVLMSHEQGSIWGFSFSPCAQERPDIPLQKIKSYKNAYLVAWEA